MAQHFTRPQIIREGRDATIAERLLGAEPAACPYPRHSKRRILWNIGARRARITIDQLMRIGA